MKRKIISTKRFLICMILLGLSISMPVHANEYSSYLYTPTSIEKINDRYFIVDCWQHRVIYNDNLTDKISEWKVLDDELAGPHSIASDGEILIVDDTDNQALKVFKEKSGEFMLVQTIEDIGSRPHKVVYDDNTNMFYVISSGSQEIVALKNEDGLIKVEYKKELSFLEGAYVRSISIIDGKMYFVAGPSKIFITNYRDASYDIEMLYNVPGEFVGMNHIKKIGAYYYITIYTDSVGSVKPRILKMKNLCQLEDGTFYDIYSKMGFKGTPYYFSFIDDRVFITEIDGYSSIKSFRVENEQIIDIITHYDSGEPREDSIKRKNEPYKVGIK